MEVKKFLKTNFRLLYSLYLAFHNVLCSYRHYKSYHRSNVGSRDEKFSMFFCWWVKRVDDHPIVKFIKTRQLSSPKQTFAIIHPFYQYLHSFLNFVKCDVKIFYTGENLKRDNFSYASDHLLSRKDVDLALGFEYFENKRYVRFPLWLEYVFDFSSSEDQIRERCKELRYPVIGDRKNRCALIASHDDSTFLIADVGIRTQIYNSTQNVLDFDFAGKFMHNDDTLKTEFDDNKIEYLKQYAFNVCPENSNSYGYVTEKLFESILAGCIPIYWGSYNNPEPDILNHDAILFYDSNNPQLLVERLTELLSDPLKLTEFLSRPRLKDGAEEVIIGKFNELDAKLRIIANK